MTEFKTIDDYVSFWQEQSLETLQDIAQEHMGGRFERDTKAVLIIRMTKAMEKYCEDND